MGTDNLIIVALMNVVTVTIFSPEDEHYIIAPMKCSDFKYYIPQISRISS